MQETLILKVSGKSNVTSVAGSIVKGIIESNKNIELHCIGASAINQCVKAIASARGILSTKGYEALVRIGFGSANVNGEEKTMIVFRIVLH